jgi:hypothetical protein
MKARVEVTCPKCGTTRSREASSVKSQSLPCFDCTHIIHGESHNPLYKVWIRLRNNIQNIPMYSLWRESFPAFKEWAEKNGYNEELYEQRKIRFSRKTRKIGYTKENCHFPINKMTKKKPKNNLQTLGEIECTNLLKQLALTAAKHALYRRSPLK